MATTYTVKKGDTLSEIAVKYDTTVNKLVQLNNIKDPDYIVVGQVLIISGSTPAPKKTNKSSKATIDLFGLQSKTERTLYATWDWDKDNTDNYEVKWVYATGDGVGFIGNKTTVDDKQSTYTAPENATHVAFYVRPISKTYESNEKEVHYWTAEWSTKVTYYFSDNPPSTPSAPTVEIKDYTLTASLENLDLNATEIQFQIVKDDSTVFKTGTATIKTNSASYSCTVTAGSEYKVRARAKRGNQYSEWSTYSSNASTKPAASSGITSLKAETETSVYLAWSSVKNADSYDIEYTTKKAYFDSSNQVQSMSIANGTHAEITGLESGEEWFFRVRAVNDKGQSAWTTIKSIKIGTAPAVPTTWSSTTTAVVGEPLTLYWNHNSEDGSSQTYATLELIIDGVTSTEVIKNTTDEKEKDKTSKYVLDTSGYSEGVKIQWRVKTRGILNAYSDWSIQRTVDIYAPPTLALTVTDANGSSFEDLGSLPMHILGVPGPNTQTAIAYHLSVVANEAHESYDNLGNVKWVTVGEEVYSQFFDITGSLSTTLSAGDLSLMNNVSYTLICTVSMNSGLTAETRHIFTVAWEDDEYWPNAEIGYDKETYSAYVHPFCTDGDGRMVEDVTLSVYRREFDGKFTELATGLSNTNNTFITDPHPALDLARYRIVATANDTGKVTYYDASYPIGEKAIIIQWDESWSNFDASSDDTSEEPAWSGSLLRLPYNVDVAEKHGPDVALVAYIGRSQPVSYYGTQLGQTATWNTVIEMTDKDSLYALRRLAIWMGDVYVREPSGTGYWAHINVTFSQKHTELLIPVTLDITRVSGGV